MFRLATLIKLTDYIESRQGKAIEDKYILDEDFTPTDIALLESAGFIATRG